jgi:hypothetical protein
MQHPEPEDNWRQLKVGDKAVVKMEIPFYPGRVGTLTSIDEAIGDYTLEFSDGSTMVYDGDMLRKASIQGRPVVFNQVERFNLREMSKDLVEYIDSTKGELTRRARLEQIVRDALSADETRPLSMSRDSYRIGLS